MKRPIAMLLVFVLVCISSVPMLPPATGNGLMEMSEPACRMKMASMNHARRAMTPAMRHCRIECCGHHDIDGLPHLLSPHTVSLAGMESCLVITDAVAEDIPVLKPRLLPFPTPPPRTT